TRDIHAPLANRLGIWQLKWELEDLAFRFLDPDTYRRIAHELDESRADRERYIESVKAQLGQALAEHGFSAEISGRPKHIYSIWRKMQKKQLPLDKLYDLRAVRVMVADVAACYAALGVVHSLWAPVPGEFDDYIARPKPNGYSSLHTAVVGPEGRTLEVQIRTREMHEQAELGVAAHWRYKETGGSAAGKGAGRAAERKLARRRWPRRGPGRGAGRRAGRGARLRADPEGRGGGPAARLHPAGFRLPRAHDGRAPLPRGQGQRPHRAAGPPPAQRRPGRDPYRQGA